jgi:tetratricopeptide (TPR) repeat protein
MSLETLQAIASLWKLVAASAFAFGLVLLATIYREQSRVFLGRLAKFRFKRGQTELSVNDSESTAIQSSEPAAKEAAAPPPTLKASPPSSEENPDELNWAYRMYDAFYQQDLKSAREAFEKMQAEQTDPEQKIRNEARYWEIRFEKGDTGAQEKIKQLELAAQQYPGVLSFVHQKFAECYQFSEKHDLAASAFLEAFALARTDADKARCLNAAALSFRKAGKTIQAFQTLNENFDTIVANNARATVFNAFATLYSQENNPQCEALMLEKAALARPNVAYSHFQAAYAFAKIDHRAIAVWHYTKALEIDARYGDALNNLGVLYGELKLPKLASDYYKKAVEVKETLAAANLAHIFLDAGLIDEAGEILGKARTEDNVHPNVNGAVVRLQNIRTETTELQTKILGAGEQVRQFLSETGETLADKIQVREGSWISSTASEVSLSKLGPSKVRIEWTDDASNNKYQATIELFGLYGSGYTKKFKPDTFAFGPDKGKGTFEDFGLAYLAADAEATILRVLIITEDQTTTYRWAFSHPPPTVSETPVSA